MFFLASPEGLLAARWIAGSSFNNEGAEHMSRSLFSIKSTHCRASVRESSLLLSPLFAAFAILLNFLHEPITLALRHLLKSLLHDLVLIVPQLLHICHVLQQRRFPDSELSADTMTATEYNQAAMQLFVCW